MDGRGTSGRGACRGRGRRRRGQGARFRGGGQLLGGCIGWGKFSVAVLNGLELPFVLFFDFEQLTGAAQVFVSFLTVFLEGGDFTVEAAEHVHQVLVLGQGGFDVGAGDGFVDEQLGDASGGGLETDFGQFGRLIAPDVIEKSVLDMAMVGEVRLFVEPVEVTAGGPVGKVAFGYGEAAFIDGANDLLIGRAVGDHAVDHVAAVLGEAGDEAVAAEFAERGRGRGNFDDGECLRLGRRCWGKRLGRDGHGQGVHGGKSEIGKAAEIGFEAGEKCWLY